MVQLGPVYFLKERMSQDGMLTALSQAAQAHGGILGHELSGEGEKESQPFNHRQPSMSQDGRHELWRRGLCETFWPISPNLLTFPSRAAQSV